MDIRTATQAVRHELVHRAKNAGADARSILGSIAPHGTPALTDAVRESRDKLSRAATTTRRVQRDAIARAAGTRVGIAIGSSTQRVAVQAAALPLLSLPRAVLSERRGVAHLHRLVKAAPAAPVHAVQLAEALHLLQRDSRVLLGLRTLWNPTAPVVAYSLKVAVALDDGQLAEPDVAMLRRAYALSVVRLRADRDDAEALHVVARVFLAMGQPEHGIKPCNAAVSRSRSSTTRAQALYTLSRLHHLSGDAEAAHACATAAVDAGCSLGWAIKAELLEVNATTGMTERMANYRSMLGRVDPDDEMAYRGFQPPAPEDLCKVVARGQFEMTAEGYRQVVESVRRLQHRAGSAGGKWLVPADSQVVWMRPV